jgi:hypothetical protein
MDWHLALLLLAIAVTYFAWRRARRQSELARASAPPLEPARWTYRLEPRRDDGGGYVIVSADGTHLPDDAITWDVHGLDVIRIPGGGDLDPGALGDDRFDPGSGVQLISEGDATAQRLGVWDEAGSVRLGTVGPEDAVRATAYIERRELTDCIVLGESTADGVRTGLVLLLVHRDTAVEA